MNYRPSTHQLSLKFAAGQKGYPMRLLLIDADGE